MYENEWETDEELIEAAAVLCMSPEELWKAIESARGFFGGVEIERKKKKVLYKVDFMRPKIRHQVACRKPRVTRKIIY